MQHSHRVDRVKWPLLLEVQQAASLDAQLPHPLSPPGAPQAFPRHLKGPGTDVHGQNRRVGVEVAEVVGAHAGAAAGVEHPPGPGPPAGGPWRQRPTHRCHDAIDAPTPVVARGWSVLERIAGEGEAVVEGAHHRRGGIQRGGGLQGRGASQGWGGQLLHGERVLSSSRALALPDSPIGPRRREAAANICSCAAGGPGGEP